MFTPDKDAKDHEGFHGDDQPDESPLAVIWRGEGQVYDEERHTGPGWYYAVLIPGDLPEFVSPDGRKWALADDWNGPFQTSTDAYNAITYPQVG
jgi:hypothetical protein